MNVGKDFIQKQQNQPQSHQPILQQPLAQSILYVENLNIKSSHFMFVNHKPVQIKFRYFSPSSCKNPVKSFDSCKEQPIKKSKLKKITLDVQANDVSQIYSVADENYSRSSLSRRRKKKTIKKIEHDSQFYYKNQISQINTKNLEQFQKFQKQLFDIKVKKKRIIKLNPNRSKISKIEASNLQNKDSKLIHSEIISKYETPIRAIYLADKSRISQKFNSEQKKKKISHSKNSKIQMVSKGMNNTMGRNSNIKIFLNQQKNNENQRGNFRFQMNNRSQMNSKSLVNSHSKSRKGISVTSSSRSNIKKLNNFSKLNKNIENEEFQNKTQKINIRKSISNTNHQKQVQIIKITQKRLKMQQIQQLAPKISQNKIKKSKNKQNNNLHQFQ